MRNVSCQNPTIKQKRRRHPPYNCEPFYGFNIPSEAGLAEDHTVTMVGPIVSGSNDLEPSCREFVDQEFLRYAVTTAVLGHTLWNRGS